jgi:hypothetical protein
MDEVKKNKKELIKEAQELADIILEKKSTIETALNELDSKTKITSEHLSGMAIIEQIFTEIEEVELEQLKVFEAIKNK